MIIMENFNFYKVFSSADTKIFLSNMSKNLFIEVFHKSSQASHYHIYKWQAWFDWKQKEIYGFSPFKNHEMQ